MSGDLKNPAVMGKKIFKLLEKNKILLLQDKAFPNIVSEIVGEPIRGSWWGHPLANPIYNGLGWMEHNRPILTVKLIDGKVTYFHESLFEDLYAIVSEPRDWQTKKLKDDELQLFKYIGKKKKITSEDSQLAKLSDDPKKALTNLEKKLLVYSEEEHTESGKHIKEYMTWEKSKIATATTGDYLKAKARIQKIIDQHCDKSGAKVKLPWG